MNNNKQKIKVLHVAPLPPPLGGMVTYIQGLLTSDVVKTIDSDTVAAGTSVGKSCKVAANAVLNNEYPDNVMLGGVPARIIKQLDG